MRRFRLPYERALPRRTLLRGAVGGVSIALGLPLLEAMMNEHGTAHADGSPLPRRLVTWMWGNGCRLEHWVPKATGPNYELSEELLPLAKHREDFAVLTGFENPVAGRRGHHDGMAGLFSGHPFVQLDPMGAPYASKFGARSIDQLAADWIAAPTMFKSLQVGVTKRHLTNQGPTLETMSHRGPDQPLPMERDPHKLYDLLFGAFAPGGQGADPDAGRRVAAIDLVMRDAKRLKERVGSGDRQRLDMHLESLFALEKQILAIPPECDLPMKPEVPGYGPDGFGPDGSEPLTEINAVMCKLVAVALGCDLTRVVSFMFTGPSGAQQFDALAPSAFPEFPAAPDLSHADQHMVSHVNAPYEQTYMHRATTFCMQHLGVLLDELADASEGAGRLLDNACVFASTDVCEGWSHSESDYPILVAGRAGGRLKSGVGHYRSASSESITDVGLACLKAVVPDPDAVLSFGGSDGVYNGKSTTPCSAILA